MTTQPPQLDSVPQADVPDDENTQDCILDNCPQCNAPMFYIEDNPYVECVECGYQINPTTEGFKQAWHEVMTGQTHDIATLWDD